MCTDGRGSQRHRRTGGKRGGTRGSAINAGRRTDNHTIRSARRYVYGEVVRGSALRATLTFRTVDRDGHETDNYVAVLVSTIGEEAGGNVRDAAGCAIGQLARTA